MYVVGIFFNDYNILSNPFEEGILCSCGYYLAMMLKYRNFTEIKVFQKIDCSYPLQGKLYDFIKAKSGVMCFLHGNLFGLVMPRLSGLQFLCLNWYNGY